MNATKQATHTPGPWSNRNADHIDGSDGTCVACVNRPDGGDRDVESANARLIAAAPDLLAALRATEARLTAAARAFYGTGTRKALEAAFDGWKADAEAARTAIARATA